MAFNIEDYLPKQPSAVHELRVSNDDIITELIYKELYMKGKRNPIALSKVLKIGAPVINEMLGKMKKEEMVSIVGGSGMGMDFIYQLFPKGMDYASKIYQKDPYMGPVPVNFKDFTKITKIVLQKARESFKINQEYLEEKFQGHVGYRDVLMSLGRAAAAKKAVFLFGNPGNGKTFISSQVILLLPPIIVPYVVEAAGQILRIFDSATHKTLDIDPDLDFDKRWVPVQPPFIMVGGELTLEALEVSYNQKFGCYDAPPQIKANGGVLLVDDLGRQRCSVEEIFNRFIVPLETKIDFMVLGGQRMDANTDEIMLFSTNLDPKDIVDDAFLRRLPYKINMRNPNKQEFHDLFKMYADKRGLTFTQENLEFLFGLYRRDKRGLRAVQPRDIVEQVYDYINFSEIEDNAITNDQINMAYETYFVKMLTLVDDPV
ncbi:hypothetical protein ACFL35_15400 [Candidatus Riflebacteria bacterium]